MPTYDTGRRVETDRRGFGDRRIKRANHAIAKGISLKRYRREHLWVKTIKPSLEHLRWSKLRRVRFSQVRNAVASFFRVYRAE